MKNIKCKWAVLITLCVSIVLNMVLLVNLFSLEKVIEINKPSTSIKISPPLRALKDNREGRIYEISTGTESSELEVINIKDEKPLIKKHRDFK